MKVAPPARALSALPAADAASGPVGTPAPPQKPRPRPSTREEAILWPQGTGIPEHPQEKVFVGGTAQVL